MNIDMNNPQNQTIKNRVLRILAEQFGVEVSELTMEKKFVEDLGGDSLDSVEVIIAIEDEFNLTIPDKEGMAITTVQDSVDYVLQRRGDLLKAE